MLDTDSRKPTRRDDGKYFLTQTQTRYRVAHVSHTIGYTGNIPVPTERVDTTDSRRRPRGGLGEVVLIQTRPVRLGDRHHPGRSVKDPVELRLDTLRHHPGRPIAPPTLHRHVLEYTLEGCRERLLPVVIEGRPHTRPPATHLRLGHHVCPLGLLPAYPVPAHENTTGAQTPNHIPTSENTASSPRIHASQRSGCRT